MNLFYVPLVESEELLLGQEESKHISRVLRMGSGDTVHVTDGKGTLIETCIIDPDPKGVRLAIKSKKTVNKPGPSLHVAIAPTKNLDRTEWFCEKATELGIERISPLICERSERRSLKTERLERVLVAAMKQSLHLWKPALDTPVSFKEFVARTESAQKLVGKADAEMHFGTACKKGVNTLVLIGPEGDFTDSEMQMASGSGFRPVNLGSSRLRTETAGMVAVACFRFVNA